MFKPEPLLSIPKFPLAERWVEVLDALKTVPTLFLFKVDDTVGAGMLEENQLRILLLTVEVLVDIGAGVMVIELLVVTPTNSGDVGRDFTAAGELSSGAFKVPLPRLPLPIDVVSAAVLA